MQENILLIYISCLEGYVRRVNDHDNDDSATLLFLFHQTRCQTEVITV